MSELPAAAWEGIGAGELASRWGVPAVHLYEEIGSTSDAARALALAGAPSGTLVLAERQTAGRGRVGRPWASPPGLGIWLSLVLRPERGAEAGALPLLVGLAVAAALDPFLQPSRARIKWPNDVVVSGLKLAGILCEGVWEGDGLGFVVVGIGLNVGHAPADFPPELRDGATSLRIASGGSPSRLEVATALVRGVAGLAAGPLVLTPERQAELEERNHLRGRRVAVTEPASGGHLAEGTVLGIAPDGALLLRTTDGVLRAVRSGTVRLAAAGPA